MTKLQAITKAERNAGAGARVRGARRMTRSTIARIIRYGRSTGSIPAGTSAVGLRAYVRGFVRGLALR